MEMEDRGWVKMTLTVSRWTDIRVIEGGHMGAPCGHGRIAWTKAEIGTPWQKLPQRGDGDTEGRRFKRIRRRLNGGRNL